MCSLSGIYVQQVLFLVGLHLAGANVAAMFQPLSPMVVAGFAVALKMEKFSVLKGIAFLLALSGCVVMAGWHIYSGGKSSFGDVILVIQVRMSRAKKPVISS